MNSLHVLPHRIEQWAVMQSTYYLSARDLRCKAAKLTTRLIQS
jgi:hypothetical protein